MQVSNFAILLVLVTFGAFFVSDVSAESEIFVTFDQNQYQTGDSLTISGNIQQVTMPEIAMSIYDPDGKILSANSIQIDSENNFSKTIMLEAPFYEKSGEYRVKLDYLQITQDEYFVISGDSYDELIFEEEISPEIILLLTDKPVYTDGDTITITGLVSSLDSPTALVGVYDTFGTPAGFYFGQVDSNLEFTVSFMAKAGVNFKTDGTYSIKAHYAESEQTVEFDFYELLVSDETFDEIIDQEIIDEIETVNETLDEIDNTINDTPIDETPEPELISEPVKENILPKTEPVEIIDESPIITKPKNNEEKKSDSVKPKSQKDIAAEKQFQKTQNLSVDDIELGLMLNQINLNCDRSTYTDSISYYDGMGPALYRLCKFDNSINYFDDTLADDPNNIEALTNKGSALRKLGFYSEALNFYDQALDIDSKYLPALNNKANVLALLGQYDEAIYLYQLVLQENPNYLTVRKNLTIALSEMPVKTPTPPEVETVKVSLESESVKEIPKNIKEESTTVKKKTPNFLEEIGNVFSSLFGFLN